MFAKPGTILKSAFAVAQLVVIAGLRSWSARVNEPPPN
jgi:hypothetical protein